MPNGRQRRASSFETAARHESKRAETILFRPAFSSRSPPSADMAIDRTSLLPFASALPERLVRRLGFADGLLMIPAAAAERFVQARGALVDRLGLTRATIAGRRTASGWKWIDFGRPLTCGHRTSPCRRDAARHGAPDSFSCGYETGYRWCSR